MNEFPPIAPPSTLLSPPAPAHAAPNTTRSFASVVQNIGREAQRGEHLVEQVLGIARNGQKIEPADLLALQAGIYRYGEVVDLTSKLVDRATQAVKTVTQGGNGG
jgi:hypothetical protein